MRRGLPGPQFWEAPRAESSGEMPSAVQHGATVQLATYVEPPDRVPSLQETLTCVQVWPQGTLEAV